MQILTSRNNVWKRHFFVSVLLIPGTMSLTDKVWSGLYCHHRSSFSTIMVASLRSCPANNNTKVVQCHPILGGGYQRPDSPDMLMLFTLHWTGLNGRLNFRNHPACPVLCWEEFQNPRQSQYCSRSEPSQSVVQIFTWSSLSSLYCIIN